MVGEESSPLTIQARFFAALRMTSSAAGFFDQLILEKSPRSTTTRGMANFQTHLTASTVLGIGYGAVAHQMYGVPMPTALLAAGFCSVSGMLPDIDSGPGRPLREITTFMASVIPAMLLGRLFHAGVTAETAILVGAILYVVIRFGLTAAMHHLTVHRGMFHSLPAMAIFGELTYLLIGDDNDARRWFLASAVMAGYFSHLLLDEIYSVQWNGAPRVKKSFGTAIKFFGEGWWPNLTTYVKLSVLTLVVLREPGIIGQLQQGHIDGAVQQIARGIAGRSGEAAPPVVQYAPGDGAPGAAAAPAAPPPPSNDPPPAWR
jgi:hypothetical protein